MDYSHPGAADAEVSTIELLGDSVIPVVNKLQDIFAQLGSSSNIDLPQVAVVGSQSSGKSSVLESLVGKDFLPRGNDVVTRRPLVLQLVQVPKRADGRAEEWGEFLHLPGKRFTDFSAIRDEIQLETERETGINKGISEKQIRLKIFSPYVITITLVDLPGITKVPVGDQPSDIEARVRSMILAYIKHESCVILAVSPANSDLANSDALQIARVADPDGHRTIGVITKLDIMDRGTDARNFLLGNVIPLRLGYIGVINRSQEDINGKKSVKDALMHEESFFRSRPVYHSLSDRCGIPQLAKKLNTILVQHIRTLLPDLKARINAQMVTVQKELLSYGEAAEKGTMGILLLNILTNYSQAFTTVVDGKNQSMSTQELAGGARVHYIFQNIFVRCLDEVDPCEDLSDDDIRTAIQNATGTKNALFVPDVPFEVLAKRQIARLLDPSLQCARFVYDELVKISHRCETYELARFPVLRRRMEEVVGSFLREGLSPAETMIGHIISMEMDYINTSHPNFVGGSRAVEMVLQRQRSDRARLGDGTEGDAASSGAAENGGGKGGDRQASGLAAATSAGGGPGGNIVTQPGGGRQRAMLTHKEGAGEQSGRSKAGAAANGTAAGGGTSWGFSSLFSQDKKGGGGGTGGGTSGDGSASAASSSAAGGTGSSGAGANAGAGGGFVDGGLLAGPMDGPSTIMLREPPAILRAGHIRTPDEAVEIGVTRLLLKSYFDIVRRNVQDAVPKAIMHFLVNHAKRELHSVFIRQLYRENQFEEMLQEKEEVAVKRARCKEIFNVLQQAAWTMDELPLDPESDVRSVSSSLSSSLLDATGLPSTAHHSALTSGMSSHHPSHHYGSTAGGGGAGGVGAGSRPGTPGGGISGRGVGGGGMPQMHRSFVNGV